MAWHPYALMSPDMVNIAMSQIARDGEGMGWLKWFRRYDALITAGISETEALAIVEASQADERANTRKAA